VYVRKGINRRGGLNGFYKSNREFSKMLGLVIDDIVEQNSLADDTSYLNRYPTVVAAMYTKDIEAILQYKEASILIGLTTNCLFVPFAAYRGRSTQYEQLTEDTLIAKNQITLDVEMKSNFNNPGGITV